MSNVRSAFTTSACTPLSRPYFPRIYEDCLEGLIQTLQPFGPEVEVQVSCDFCLRTAGR